ncbi:hypothetical protein JCM3774_006590 [Rhodotorula dairenensis]
MTSPGLHTAQAELEKALERLRAAEQDQQALAAEAERETAARQLQLERETGEIHVPTPALMRAPASEPKRTAPYWQLPWNMHRQLDTLTERAYDLSERGEILGTAGALQEAQQILGSYTLEVDPDDSAPADLVPKDGPDSHEYYLMWQQWSPAITDAFEHARQGQLATAAWKFGEGRRRVMRFREGAWYKPFMLGQRNVAATSD